MRLRRQPGKRRETGFTLAEVLAALLFMAIVIPVAIQGMRVASLAGEVAEHKSQAGRIAERILNENLTITNANTTDISGLIVEGTREFQYTLRTEQWNQQITNRLPATASTLNQLSGGQPAVDQLSLSQLQMNLVTVEVQYAVQNDKYKVRLSTLQEVQQ